MQCNLQNVLCDNLPISDKRECFCFRIANSAKQSKATKKKQNKFCHKLDSSFAGILYTQSTPTTHNRIIATSVRHAEYFRFFFCLCQKNLYMYHQFLSYFFFGFFLAITQYITHCLIVYSPGHLSHWTANLVRYEVIISNHHHCWQRTPAAAAATAVKKKSFDSS